MHDATNIAGAQIFVIETCDVVCEYYAFVFFEQASPLEWICSYKPWDYRAPVDLPDSTDLGITPVWGFNLHRLPNSIHRSQSRHCSLLRESAAVSLERVCEFFPMVPG